VVVTPRSYRDADREARERLEGAVAEVRYNDRGRALTAAELHAELADADGVIAGLDQFSAEVIARAHRLRCIARYGIGVDNVDLDAAAGRGIVVTNTPDANADAVAELALGLMLALLRHVVELDRRVRSGTWSAARGAELGASTVGVVGLGRIGSGVARRASALGARVLAADPFVGEDVAAKAGAKLVALEELLAEADIVSLHAPVGESTRGLIDRRALSLMQPGALLVNTARGELVDEQALADALRSGSLGGAALDSLAAEPPPADHPLLELESVIITPHVGAQTAEALGAMARTATDDLLAVLGGQEPRFPVARGERVQASR
jgi:D-3-phosphoglycerate dehydrogenase